MSHEWPQGPYDHHQMWTAAGPSRTGPSATLPDGSGMNGEGFRSIYVQPRQATVPSLNNGDQSQQNGELYKTASNKSLAPPGFKDPYASFGMAEGQNRPFYAGPPATSMPGPSDKASTSESSVALKRGMACTFCRRRKLKCSGGKPKCTSCIRYAQECEYAAPSKQSKSQGSENKTSEVSDRVQRNTAEEPPPLALPAGNSSTPRSLIQSTFHGPDSHLPQNSSDSRGDQFPTPPTPLDPGPFNTDGFSSRPAAAAAMVPEPGWPIYHGQTPAYDTDSYLTFADHGSHSHSNASQTLHAAPFNMTLSDGYSPFGASSQTGHSSVIEHGAPVIIHSVLDPNGDQRRSTQFGVEPQQSIPQAGYDPTDYLTRMPLDIGVSAGLPYPSTGTAPHVSQVPAPTFASPPPPSTNASTTEMTNAQQKASAAQFFRAARQSSQPHTLSAASTPESHIGPPLHQTVDPAVTAQYERPLPKPGMMYGLPRARVMVTNKIDPVDGLTERLGEFLFNPLSEGSPPGTGASQRDDDGAKKKRRGVNENTSPTKAGNNGLMRVESDGLTESARTTLLDCFLAHSRLFFEMSIPRFRYRMTFLDRRRPALALLYAMYLWATRMSNSPDASPMEQHFFMASCQALDVSTANADRLIDCMRAAMLLSAYSYTSGRYHEGWVFGGVAIRLILSSGLHQIRSCVFTPEKPKDKFLRGQTFLLPPPEDATELAERISTFWGILSIERCGSLATGFPSGIVDADITTPFPPAFNDIAVRAVTAQDDLTIRDLYRHSYFPVERETALSKWLKTTMILERASKLAFVDPAEDSEYSRAWAKYFLQAPSNPQLASPPAWLDQPKYRCPKDYAETKLALEQLKSNLGVEGIFPVDRRRNAEIDGAEPPLITPHTIAIHHQFAATRMFLHDINAQGVENKEALAGAREAVALLRYMPTVHYNDVDLFCITVWSVIAKVMCKELRRLALLKDTEGMKIVSDEIDCFITVMEGVGTVAQLARSQANALAEVKKQAMDTSADDEPEEEYRRRVPNNNLGPSTGYRPENEETVGWPPA